jgi:hypothetical protein
MIATGRAVELRLLWPPVGDPGAMVETLRRAVR